MIQSGEKIFQIQGTASSKALIKRNLCVKKNKRKGHYDWAK